MNWLAECFMLITVGVMGTFAIKIPLLIISPFDDFLDDLYFQSFVMFAVFAVFLFQMGRVVRKNTSDSVKKSLEKKKKFIVLPLLGVMIFSGLLFSGYITDDVRYGSCIITSGDEGTRGGSYSILDSEQECREDCALSGHMEAAGKITVQCNFNGLGYTWNAAADRDGIINENSMHP